MRPDRKPLVYSYLRFSSAPQELGDSIRRQNDLIQKWCKDRGLELDESYRMEDRGLSGYHGDNLLIGELGKFLEDVKQGRIESGSYLILESLDRFSRAGVNESIHRLTGLLTHGIRIFTLADGKEFSNDNPSDIMSLMQMVMESGRAHSESAHKSKRVKEAWEGKRIRAQREGHVLTRIVPYGYRVEGRDYSSGKPQGGRIVIDPEESLIVTWIFECASQGQSPSAITRALNKDRKIKARKGGLWCVSAIDHILHNRSYLTGEYQPCVTRRENGKEIKVASGEVMQNYYPNLIPPALWKNVHNNLINKPVVKRTPHKHGLTNLFTGKIVCAECGETVTVKTNASGRSYYQCYSSKYGYGCDSRSLPGIILECQFLMNLCEVLDKEASHKSDNSQLRDIMNQVADKELEKSTLQRKIDTWDEELVYRDDAGKKALRAKIMETGKEVTRLSDEITSLHTQMENVKDTKGFTKTHILGTLLNDPVVSLKSPESRVDLKSVIDRVVKHIGVDFLERQLYVQFNDEDLNDEGCAIDLPDMKVKEYLEELGKDELFDHILKKQVA